MRPRPLETLRLTAPPIYLVILFVLFFGLAEGSVIVAWWERGIVPPVGIPSVGERILGFAAMLFGIHRVVGFHPIFRPGYRGWLERTPWTARQALPLGPVGLVLEDALTLGLLSALAALAPRGNPYLPWTMAFLASSGFVAFSLPLTGIRGHASLVMLLAGLSARLWPHPRAACLAALATLVVARIGLWRSLARFPWELEPVRNLSSEMASQVESGKGSRCGWPYDLIRPPAPLPFRFDVRDALMLSLVLGWWLHASQGLFEDPREAQSFGWLMLGLGTAACVIVRFLSYRNGHAPPLSLGARFTTGRFLIPSYDQIYVGPFLAMLAGWTTVLATRHFRVDPMAATATGLAVVVFVSLKAPPGLTRWRLTGGHRLSFPGNANFFTKVG